MLALQCGKGRILKNNTKKQAYRALLNAFARSFGSKCAKKFDARFRFGRKLDLENPKTLADKVSWIELNTHSDLVVKCTDKYDVRDYVKQKGLEKILIPICGGPWSSVDKINIDALPDAFVMKATHGCEMNYLVPDKGALDPDDLLAHAQKWLEDDYPRACVEPHYKLIPHRLYAENFIGGMDKIVDYKFHCINGEPCFVLTCSERDKGLKLNLYDLDWKPIGGLQGPMKNSKQVSKPQLLEEMLEAAKMLSSDFDFVRVDLYEVGGKVMFGELTFSPACGVMDYYTDEFVAEWGEALRVDGLS